MSDSWDTRRKALEEDYFQRREQEALKRLSERQAQSVRLSPISQKPMVQKNVLGVIIDQCEQSGGVWLDAGELRQIVELAKEAEPSRLEHFFKSLMSSFTAA
jgi:hypothetical protein